MSWCSRPMVPRCLSILCSAVWANWRRAAVSNRCGNHPSLMRSSRRTAATSMASPCKTVRSTGPPPAVPATRPPVGAINAREAVWWCTSPQDPSPPPGSPCPTPRVGTKGSSGCSIPAPASWGGSSRDASSRSAPYPDLCGGWPLLAAAPWWVSPSCVRPSSLASPSRNACKAVAIPRAVAASG